MGGREGHLGEIFHVFLKKTTTTTTTSESIIKTLDKKTKQKTTP